MDRVRRQLGLTGRYWETGRNKVTIAVLDSGLEMHPDLRDSLLTFRDFTRDHGQKSRQLKPDQPHDEYGHGTHVCGILCGNGQMSDGRYRGICPKARLVVGKVLDHKGEGAALDMIAGMEWILETREEYDTRLLNISVGVSQLRNETNKRRLREMMERLTRSGILIICAAGNRGPGSDTMSFLGEGEEVICVGCHDGVYFRSDPFRCESHSGRGRFLHVPRKPDVVAPGTRIRSCSSRWQSGKDEGYEMRSGTSMATPIVTGSFALALQERPKLRPQELKQLMIRTATDLGEAWNKQGFGMINPVGMLECIVKEEQFT